MTMLLSMQPGMWLAFWAVSAFLAHFQFFIHQYPQFLLLGAALSLLMVQPVSVFGIAPSHVQDLTLGLFDLHVVHMGPPL